jgi:peptidoglycan/xylan/chitin deacetylase (PgdA/CDA1 family)
MGIKTRIFKILASLIGLWAFIALAVLCFGFLFSSNKYTVPIMMYHHVNNKEFEAEDVTPENFRKQMNFLKTYRYHVISLGELVETEKAGKKLPRNTVVIAFDDGNLDNYAEAFPILKEFQFPVIFFVSPGFFNRPGFMSWKEIKKMQQEKFVSFGSHGMTQAYFPSLDQEHLRYEIIESKKILEEGLKTKIDYIAYPVGGFTDEIKVKVQNAGYKAAVTTNRGYDRFDKDLYEINRIRFSNADVNPVIIAAKLSGFYNRFRDLKKPY